MKKMKIKIPWTQQDVLRQHAQSIVVQPPLELANVPHHERQPYIFNRLMQGSHRDKKSFSLTLGDEEGHESMEVDLRLLEFPPLDDCREPLFRRRLEGVNEEEKICVTTQQMNTSSIPSTPPCLQIYSPRGQWVHKKFRGMCLHQNLGRCTGSPKLREACVSVEHCPNFQHCPHHLLRWELSYTSSSLMNAPQITHLNCTESGCIFKAGVFKCVSVECPNFQHRPHHLLCWEPSYTLSSLTRAPQITHLNYTESGCIFKASLFKMGLGALSLLPLPSHPLSSLQIPQHQTE